MRKASYSLIFIILSFLQLSDILEASKSDSFDTMKWKPGDLIRCSLRGFITSFADHLMMAVTDDDVVHVVGNRVLKQHRYYVSDNIMNKTKCSIRKSAGKAAAARAMRYIGVCVPYNLMTCNCQHYAMYWAYGDMPSWTDVTSLRSPSGECLQTDVEKKRGYCPEPKGFFESIK